MLGIGLAIEGEEELSIWILVFQGPLVKLKLADRFFKVADDGWGVKAFDFKGNFLAFFFSSENFFGSEVCF